MTFGVRLISYIFIFQRNFLMYIAFNYNCNMSPRKVISICWWDA